MESSQRLAEIAALRKWAQAQGDLNLKAGLLGMGLDDLTHVSERGRWWLVGSAWSGHAPTAASAVETPANDDIASGPQKTEVCVCVS